MDPETRLFIQALFGNCTSAGTPSFLTLSAIHPDGSHPTPSCHVPLQNGEKLQTAMDRLRAANERGWGAYVGVATRQAQLGRWSRGGKYNLVELPALFVDIDDPGCALWQLTFFEPPPSIIVHSGRGYHAYWLLNSPTTDFATADRLLKELAHRLGGDSALTVAQSMRLVGTANTKAGREEALCSLVHFAPELQYALSEFTPLLPPPPPLQWSHWQREWEAGRDWHISGGSAIAEAVTEAVIHNLDGYSRHNGFIAARCPLPHAIDRPGMHFSYAPRSGVGFCFGKHGRIPLREMRTLMGVER